MSVLKTIERDKVKFLMDFDYNNVLGRMKFVLGKDASFFADIRVRQNDVSWITRDDREYISFTDANEEEKQIIKEKVNEHIVRLTDLISGDSLIGPYKDKIVSYPSSQYIYYTIMEGVYEIILTGWGCDTADEEKNRESVVSESVNECPNTEKKVEQINYHVDNVKNDVADNEQIAIVEVPGTEDNKESVDKESSVKEDGEEGNTNQHKEPCYTSEWLKEHTNIHGWLSFFLFAIAVGGLISAVYPIVTFNAADYGGSMWLGAVDIMMGIFLLAIAICTIYTFTQRKPNAVFYGRFYVLLVFVTNIISLMGGADSALGGVKQASRGIISGIVWLLYLLYSSQVQEIIPKSFRKVSKLDWGVLVVVVMIPCLCFAIGLSNIYTEVENREGLEADIYELQLADNERTDGRVIFSVPSTFECQLKEVETAPGAKLKVFTINNESIGDCTLCSDYDSDTSVKNFDVYWNNWEAEGDKIYPKTNVDRGSKYINGHNCLFRIIRYTINGIHVYWRFYILFDEMSGKCCVVSFYDCNESISYVDEILNSIRFK